MTDPRNVQPDLLLLVHTQSPYHRHEMVSHSHTHTHTGGETGASSQLLYWQTWLPLLSQCPVTATFTQTAAHTLRGSVGPASVRKWDI